MGQTCESEATTTDNNELMGNRCLRVYGRGDAIACECIVVTGSATVLSTPPPPTISPRLCATYCHTIILQFAVTDFTPTHKIYSVTANSVWVLLDKWSVILHIAVLSDQLAALWWMLTWCAVFERPWEIKCFSCLGVGVAPCHLVPAQH